MTTSTLKATIDMASEHITFYDVASGTKLTADFAHRFVPTTDPALGNASSYVLSQSWQLAPDEGLYGGGQYQNGYVGFEGMPIEMVQYNTEAVVPFFASTRGYGILWDNNAWSHLNPPEGAPLHFSKSPSGALVASFTPTVSGDHAIFADLCAGFGCGSIKGGVLSLAVVDNSSGAEWDRLANLPDSISGKARGLRAGVRYELQLVGTTSAEKVFVVPPSKSTTIRSKLGKLIDYYFASAGPAAPSPLDGAISGYRNITGAAHLYGRWAYGFWQCKEHYKSQAELLAAAARFREERIPLDAIVQDWLYWGSLGWGPQWDPASYPDPAALVAQLREAHHLKLMVSVWSKFDRKTSFYKAMAADGCLLNGSNYYDAWSSAARERFYSFSKAAHFAIGVESLWLDATEPENFPNRDQRCAGPSGSGNADFNSYSLQTTRAIADGLRRDFGDSQGRRVFSLTRSAFAGQQRTGATLWSGDISGAWDALRRQVAASLNYAASGMPYWSEDIGGFFRPDGQHTDRGYAALLTRWFQFGVFTPIFRVHGTNGNTELWEFGAQTQHHIVQSAIRLRYRLLPYIYSGFHRVAAEGYTMQRALAFDFPESARARTTADAFMFGPALLVAPLVSNATSRSVHLPPTPGAWRGFYDGQPYAAGDVTASPAIDEVALYARAGSLVLLGPDLQHADEKPADPLEVRVYDGADASFTLYEDDGVSAADATGGASSGSATIRIAWDDAAETLTVGARAGSFPGMLAARTLHLVRVAPGRGVGVAPAATPDRVVAYSGAKLVVSLRTKRVR